MTRKFDSSHCITQEDFLNYLKEYNSVRMKCGIEQGWWESVSDNGEPIPFPTEFKLSEHPNIETIVVELGMFSSVTQARKNKFSYASAPGIHFLAKRKFRIKIIDDTKKED